MAFAEYEHFDALGLAALVKQGELTAQELLEEAIGRVERRNPTVNAVICRMYDSARSSIERGLPEGLFRGVPFLLKDLGPAVGGVRQTMGSGALANYVPSEDSVYTQRAKAAGLVLFGKTNTPEFGAMPYTEPVFTGITRNPWNAGRTPGGSSGGSAAAVAAGMVPMAHGNDGGGSIRIPASCCGLCGLKPSRGRPPKYGGAATPGDLAVDHVITRSVRDSAAMLDITSERQLKTPPGGFLAALGQKNPRLRIAVCRNSLLGKNVDPEALKAVEHTEELLRRLGHTVEDSIPQNIERASAGRAFAALFVNTIGHEVATVTAKRGGVPPGRKDMETTSRFAEAFHRSMREQVLNRAMTEARRIADAMATFHQRYDLLLTPTLGAPPVKVGSLQPKPLENLAMDVCCVLKASAMFDAIIKSIADTAYEWVAFTPIANMTGQPSISLPLYWTADGLPVGSLLTAAVGEESTLLNLAAELEQACPWFEKRPASVGMNSHRESHAPFKMAEA